MSETSISKTICRHKLIYIYKYFYLVLIFDIIHVYIYIYVCRWIHVCIYLYICKSLLNKKRYLYIYIYIYLCISNLYFWRFQSFFHASSHPFLHAHEWRLLHYYGNQLRVSKPLASGPPTATACDRCGACPLLSRIWTALLFKTEFDTPAEPAKCNESGNHSFQRYEKDFEVPWARLEIVWLKGTRSPGIDV